MINEPEDRRIRDVVIVGGGTAGWMAAAALARTMNNGVTRITLVESDEIGTIGVGEATIPPIAAFNGLLGIDEDEFLRETQGTFKLGIEFVNWGAADSRYFHQFGGFGTDIDGVRFHQLWGKLHGAGRARPLPAYSPSAAAAAAGRFARVAGDPRSPFARPAYAFHFDATLYARFLRRYAEARGVARVEGRIVAVVRGDGDDVVASVRLADGRAVAGDLFIDCSGFRALLLGDALGVGWEDWSRWLPCDRAVAIPSARTEPLLPFTRSTAHAAGWQWRIPLQHRTGNGHVYASAHMDADEAERILLAHLDAPATAAPRHLSFQAGRRREAWRGNVVGLGLAAGFLEPLESTSIHLIQSGISKLVSLFPDRRFLDVERRAYNRLMENNFREIRDFIILHYKAVRRDDTPFWRGCRDMAVPDSLAAKIELFHAKGRVIRYDDDLFTIDSWVAVMLGQGFPPDGYDPVVDTLDADRLAHALERMHGLIGETVGRMPGHADFVRTTCASPG